MRHIVQTEGAGTLFAGLGPRALRIVCAGAARGGRQAPGGRACLCCTLPGLGGAFAASARSGRAPHLHPPGPPRRVHAAPAPRTPPPAVFILNGTRNTLVDMLQRQRTVHGEAVA